MFETDVRGMFLEYSGHITSWLLEFAKRSTFVIIKSYTLNTKTTFPSRTLKKIFSSKMFRKCSLDVPNTATLREHTANIPRILRAGWEVFVKPVEGLERTLFPCCPVNQACSWKKVQIKKRVRVGEYYSLPWFKKFKYSMYNNITVFTIILEHTLHEILIYTKSVFISKEFNPIGIHKIIKYQAYISFLSCWLPHILRAWLINSSFLMNWSH